jgi:hypothetical protein
MQASCAQPQHAASVSQLHACMALAGSCQCSDAASCAALLATPSAQLQRACPSVLGCWLASLQAAQVDITKLVHVHLGQVLPRLDGLRAWQADRQGGGGAAAVTGRRRALRQTPMNQPLTDVDGGVDGSGAPTAAGAALQNGGVQQTAALGLNKPIISVDFSITPPGSGQTVEKDAPLTGAAGLNFLPESGASGGMQLESGGADGGSGSGGGAPLADGSLYDREGALPGSGGSNGTAPQAFWLCVANAAAAAKAAQTWSLAQQASRGASFDAMAASATAVPLQALDFGVAALECFSMHARTSPAVSQMAEAYEFSLLQLVRVFTSCRDLFRQYATEGGAAEGEPTARPASQPASQPAAPCATPAASSTARAVLIPEVPTPSVRAGAGGPRVLGAADGSETRDGAACPSP